MSGLARVAARRPAPQAVTARPGRPLPEAPRRAAESHFGFNFANVRVHADDWSHAATAGLGANAFTLGHHVAFRAGQFAPGTPAGDRLLRHELAHVVQQSRGGTPAPAGGDPALEADARAAADGAPVRAASGVGVACDGLGSLAPPAGKFRHVVTFPSVDAMIRIAVSQDVLDFQVQADGSVIASVWNDTPSFAAVPAPKPPAPPATRPATRPKPAPTPPAPDDLAERRRIIATLFPGPQPSLRERQVMGGLQALGGGLEVVGGALTSEFLVGGPLMLHGLDTYTSGLNTMLSGDPSPTLVHKAGRLAASPFTADPAMRRAVGDSFDFAANIAAGAASLRPVPATLVELEAAAARRAALLARAQAADPAPGPVQAAARGDHDVVPYPGDAAQLAEELDRAGGYRIFYGNPSGLPAEFAPPAVARFTPQGVTFDSKMTHLHLDLALRELERTRPGAITSIGSGTHGDLGGGWRGTNPLREDYRFVLIDTELTAHPEYPGLGFRHVYDLGDPYMLELFKVIESLGAATPSDKAAIIRAWCYSTLRTPVP